VRLLLDTQALLWWLGKSRRLGRQAHDAIADPESDIWVSAAAVWEIVIKMALGRLTITEPPEVCIPREMDQLGFQPLSVSIGHALAVRLLPLHHADPFDRILIAQARTEGLTVVTSDAIFNQYPVNVLDASA
jgi:PIN domain nuclease of toxin-antitoxin system